MLCHPLLPWCAASPQAKTIGPVNHGLESPKLQVQINLSLYKLIVSSIHNSDRKLTNTADNQNKLITIGETGKSDERSTKKTKSGPEVFSINILWYRCSWNFIAHDKVKQNVSKGKTFLKVLSDKNLRID